MGCNCEGKTINVGMGCCQPVLGPVENYYTKQQVDKLISAVTVSAVSEAWVEDYAYDKATVEEKVDTLNTKIERVNNRFDNYYTTAETSSSTEIADALTAVNDQIVSATSGMATQEWVENQGYLTEHQSLSGYATEQWVEDQGYLTEHQSLSGYATEEYVQDYTYNKATIDSKDAEKLDISDFQTYSGTVASELSRKASQSLVDALSGTVADEIARATSAETALDDKIDALESGLTNDYYTKSETSSKTEIADAITSVDTKNLDVTEFTAYTANTDTRLDNVDYRVDTISGQVADIGVNCDLRLDVLEAWKISAGTDIANLQVGLVSKADASALTDVQTALQAKQDRLIAGDNITIVNNVISAVGGASGITSGQVESMIASATSGMATEQWVLDKNYITDVDLSNYALKSEIPTVPTSNTAFTNDAGYATSGYVNSAVSGKQDTLVSGTNIKTINGESVLGSGNISVSSTGGISSAECQTMIDNSISGKTNESDFSAHTANTNIHVTTAQTASWDAKQNALTAGGGISITNNVISVTGGTEGISSAQCQAQIDQSISGKTNQSDFSAHTADTSIHVTTAQTASWDAKSDFSGSYNDLTNKPTIPNYTAGSGISITNNVISAKIWSGTQAQYNALGTYSNDTIYLVY